MKPKFLDLSNFALIEFGSIVLEDKQRKQCHAIRDQRRQAIRDSLSEIRAIHGVIRDR